MTTGCIYRFRLGRDATGAYVGELVDDWGWTIALRAEVVERDGVKVFEGAGTLTDTPGHEARAEVPQVASSSRAVMTP